MPSEAEAQIPKQVRNDRLLFWNENIDYKEKEQMDNIEKENAKLNKIKQIQQVTATSLFSEAIKEKGIKDCSVEIIKSTMAENILLVNVKGNNVLLKASANVQEWIGDVQKIVDALSDETKSSNEIFDALMKTSLPPLEIPKKLANKVTLRRNKNGKARLFAQGILKNINFQSVKELELVGMTEIEEKALYHRFEDYKLKTLIIADGVKKIGSAAFCFDNLVSATLPDSVTECGSDIFKDCEKLTSLRLPKSLRVKDIFMIPKFLKHVTLSEAVTKIDGFFNCCSLESVEIPEGVTEIEMDAFVYCKSLKSIKLPKSLVKIGMCAFSHCTSLQSIRIPNNVSAIRSYTFENCTALSSIEFDGTAEQWNKIWKEHGWKNDRVPAKVVHCSDGEVEI